jgi:hypothetical protein
MEDFSTPDLLVTENIPPFMNGGFNKAILNLHYSVGVILSTFLVPTIRVQPVSWHRFEKEWQAEGWGEYIKKDSNDAVMLGYTVIALASRQADLGCASLESHVINLVMRR